MPRVTLSYAVHVFRVKYVTAPLHTGVSLSKLIY